MYVLAQFIGQSPLACAGRNLVRVLNDAGYKPRLINRQAQYVDAETTDPVIMGALTAEEADNGILIVQGKLTDLTAVSDGDLPLHAIGILLSYANDMPAWQIEALSRYAQIWTPDNRSVKIIRRYKPNADVHLVPITFPAELFSSTYGDHVGYYTFSSSKSILEWCILQAMRRSNGEPKAVAFSPFEAQEDPQETLVNVSKELIARGEVSAWDELPDLYARTFPCEVDRCAVHHSGLTFVRTPQDHSYWEAEAAAAGAKFCCVNNGQVIVDGRSRWAFGLMARVAAIMRERIEALTKKRYSAVPATVGSITIGYVIPHGNRGAQWVESCLRALTNETQAGDGVIVSDIGSNESVFEEVKQVCMQYGVALARGNGAWNLSRARNIGAQAIGSCVSHICFLDCDVLVPQGFGVGARKALSAHPLSTALIIRVGNHRDFIKPHELPLSSWPTRPEYVRPGTGCVILASDLFFRIRGYDETYSGWGSEDVEMLYRARQEGINVRELYEVPPAYHQPHPAPPNRDEERRANVTKLFDDCTQLARKVNPNGFGKGYFLVRPDANGEEKCQQSIV